MAQVRALEVLVAPAEGDWRWCSRVLLQICCFCCSEDPGQQEGTQPRTAGSGPHRPASGVSIATRTNAGGHRGVGPAAIHRFECQASCVVSLSLSVLIWEGAGGSDTRPTGRCPGC